LKEFEYVDPPSLGEAIAHLGARGPGTQLLAGGTDLLLLIQAGVFTPDFVVDIRRIPELQVLEYDEARGLTLGAAVTLRAVETSSVIRARYPHLASSAAEIGSVQVRNLGTVGGNVCNAAPSADTIPALLTLEATARVAGPRGERTVPLGRFFTGPRQTVLQPDELLVSLQVPAPADRTGGAYLKLKTRPALDIAIVGVAATVKLEPGDGVVQWARIALGAVAPTALRVPEAEALLAGQALEPELLEKVGRAAAAACRPISDLRASAEYRREMVAVLARRAVQQAVAKARENPG
jgi:carbon-monoxide dehydrogenase medium subunit